MILLKRIIGVLSIAVATILVVFTPLIGVWCWQRLVQFFPSEYHTALEISAFLAGCIVLIGFIFILGIVCSVCFGDQKGNTDDDNDAR